MSATLLVKAALGAAGVVGAGGAAWLGLTRYEQPRDIAEHHAVVTDFLERAVAGDSAGLSARAATDQPVRWVLAAVEADAAALQEWASPGVPMSLARRGDTLWVALQHHRSTARCSYFSTLVVSILTPPDARPQDSRVLAISATCPAVGIR